MGFRGFESQFVWTINAFKWDHMVGPPFLSSAWNPIENGWIRPCATLQYNGNIKYS